MTDDKARAKSTRKPGAKRADPLAEVLATIAKMPEPDRVMAERIHALIQTTAPLSARLWYGMPAYAKDGKVICFFQAASKFKLRYATFGFQPEAALDDGAMWPTSYALTALGDAEEERIRALVTRAMG